MMCGRGAAVTDTDTRTASKHAMSAHLLLHRTLPQYPYLVLLYRYWYRYLSNIGVLQVGSYRTMPDMRGDSSLIESEE